MTRLPRSIATAITVLGMILGLVLLSPPDARADDLGISAFYGHWKGSALSQSEISLYFQLTARDIDVKVGPLDGGGFRLTWATVQRQKGDPDQPKETLKTTTVDFVPTTRAGVWRTTATNDPMSGHPYVWARLAKTTLSVYSMGITVDGAYEMQVYKRTLTPQGMKLVFTRVVDGETVRRAEGQLIKFSN